MAFLHSLLKSAPSAICAGGFLVVVAGVVPAQGYLLHTFNGSASTDDLGRSVAAVGDLDGDGRADLLVGAPQSYTGSPGYAKVYSGANGSVLRTLSGTAANDRFGWAVAGVGDLNGDGVPDLLVGSPLVDAGGLSDSGQAIVFSGANGAVLFPFTGAAAADYFGSSVAGPGDVDGDGVPDLLVGAQQDVYSSSVFGYAKVYSGANGAVLFTFAGAAVGDAFGTSVCAVGDINADGRADLVVGATQVIPGGAGYVKVFSGMDGSVLLVLAGTAAYDAFGTSIAGAGDVNADGVPDLLVGAPGEDVGSWTDAGRSRLYSGASGTAILTVSGASSYEQLGSSVAATADLDGDGIRDLLVGADSFDLVGAFNAGRLRVVSGASGATLAVIDGTAANETLGASVAAPGDVNGDGIPDLFVGAPGAAPAGLANAGRAEVFSVAGLPPGSGLFGPGCAGTSGVLPLVRGAFGPSSIGNGSFAVALSKARANAPAVLLLGATSLFVSLGPVGLPACTLLASPDVFFHRTTTAAGLAVVGLPVPLDPGLVGAVVFVQWYVVDPGPAALPGAMTSRLNLTIS